MSENTAGKEVMEKKKQVCPLCVKHGKTPNKRSAEAIRKGRKLAKHSNAKKYKNLDELFKDLDL